MTQIYDDEDNTDWTLGLVLVGYAGLWFIHLVDLFHYLVDFIRHPRHRPA